MSRRPLLWAAGVAALVSLFFAGSSEAAALRPPPADFSGAWVFDADAFAPPAAQPTPAAARRRAEIVEGKLAGSEDYARKWCTYVGLPQLMQATIPITVAQNWREVAIVSPYRAEPRHLYLDPRIKPDSDIYDNTTNGFSTGRWRGRSLVVDTAGFNDNGVLVLPGGALKSANSRLRETFRLVDPDTMEITYTWTDRTTLRRPYTYRQRLTRVKGPVWYSDAFCTPVKAMRAANLPLPPGEGGD